MRHLTHVFPNCSDVSTSGYLKERDKQENDATKSRGTGKLTLQEEAKESLIYLALQKRN